MVYSKLGDFPKAINFFLKSLKLSEELNDMDVEARTYNSLGVAYKNQNNQKEALKAYTKALALFKEDNSPENVAGSYANIGNIFINQKDYSRALYYQSKARTIFDSLKSYKGLATCYNNISNIYLELRDYPKSLKYREHALAVSREKGFFSNAVMALSGMGRIHVELKGFKTSEKYFLEGIALAKKGNSRTELAGLYKDLSRCYKEMGRTNEALALYEQYSSLKDSLFNEQSLVTLANLQTSYELDRKEASIQLLKKDNEITTLSRNRTVIASIALLLIAGLALSWQRSKIQKNRQLLVHQKELHNTQRALTEAELKASKLKEEELRKEIAYKNKSLTTYALSMVQKNEMLEEVKESVESILKRSSNEVDHFKKLSRIVDHGLAVDKDWEDFKLFFEEVHTDFFIRLRERFPDLGAADIKLCALIKLNLNMKQAAAILRISPDSVKVARYRLRKKFNLQTEDNLLEFINSL